MRHIGLWVVGISTGILSTVLFISSALRFSNDDQFILYRYVENIISGEGFVYNIGERVLGSTTPLFSLITSGVAYMVNFLSVPDVVALTNILLLSISAIFFYLVAEHFVPKLYAVGAVVIYALNLARTIPEGMETPLFLVLVFALLWAVFSKRHFLGSVLLGLLILTRPDAGLIAVLLGLYWLFVVGVRKTTFLTITTILTVLPWVLFATTYFGSFIPQSLATKLHSDDIYTLPLIQGLKIQLAHTSTILWGKLVSVEAIWQQVLLNLLPFLTVVSLGYKKFLTREGLLILLIPLAYLISFSISNPIIFPWYLSQMEPFWILLFFMGVTRITQSWKVWQKVVISVLIIAGPLYGWASLASTDDQGSKKMLFDAATYIQAHAEPTDTVGITDIGIVGYVTKLYIHDFIGLVSPASVHHYPAKCASESFYTLPVSLVEATQPDWMVVRIDQMSPCFYQSRVGQMYELVYQTGNNALGVWQKIAPQK